MFNTFKIVLLLLTLVFAGTSSGAGNLPATYPENFDRDGIITGSANSQLVYISATRYRLDPNVLVHTPGTEFASTYVLTTGTEVGFTLATEKTGRPNRITEIWVLPKGSVILN